MVLLLGGPYDRGGIWKFDTNGGGYSRVGDFDALAGGVGRNPNSPLIKGPNGDLFGVIKRRGTLGATNSDGHLYKFDIANQQLEYVTSLEAAGWAISEPTGQISYNSTLNIIYGTKDEFPGASWWWRLATTLIPKLSLMKPLSPLKLAFGQQCYRNNSGQ